MKIVIFTIGTQGDARPFVALGRRLSALGHDIFIVTSARHRQLIVEGGLHLVPIESDFAELMAREHAVMDKGNQLRIGRQMAKALCDWMPLWVEQAMAATEGAELILGSGSATALGASIAEKRRIPFVQAQFMPMTPSRHVPPLWPNPGLPLPGTANLALAHLARFLIWQVMSAPITVMRHDLGLEPIGWRGPWSRKGGHARGHYLLYAFSRHLQPQPDDWPADRIAVTGSWFYDQTQKWTPPPALMRFLEAGPKPLYIGFGSMMCGNPEAFTRMILEAVRQTGRRAIIATGWGALRALPGQEDDSLFFIENAPHDWLFPRVAMAVHHGGAGTVAAASRVGLPQVIIPFLADQFYWSWRLNMIGITPMILNRKTLTAEKLAYAIGKARARSVADKARALAPLIEAEDGIARAMAVLGHWGLLKSPLSAKTAV
ncbi:glycosyltransferase [Brytella acorum]|uniref:glycosyltransferase n=1 Tax=Brytella acorum TaxID=2959299 RepID=UPI0025ADB029|nr:glycosyltransferase [Brytella acorum]MDF3626211.1 glycosyltransferase [Brytella acorum]